MSSSSDKSQSPVGVIGYYKASSNRNSSALIRSLSIVVPAYNEQARLPETIRRIEEYLSRSDWAFHEILIVDDGSTDGTAEAAARSRQ